MKETPTTKRRRKNTEEKNQRKKDKRKYVMCPSKEIYNKKKTKK